KSELRNFEQFLEKLKQDELVRSTGKKPEEICKLRFAHEKSGYLEKFAQIKREQQMRTPSARASKSARWKKIEALKIRADFKNAWIYEIVPRTPSLSDLVYHVGFIDDLDFTSNVSFEVRVCTWTETERWVGLLQSFWSD